jgi:hypothetical protein
MIPSSACFGVSRIPHDFTKHLLVGKSIKDVFIRPRIDLYDPRHQLFINSNIHPIRPKPWKKAAHVSADPET